MRDAKTFAARVRETALQIFSGSIGDAVDDVVKLAVALFQLGEQLFDLRVVRHVALEAIGIRKRVDHLLRLLPQSLVLIGNGELGARFLELLGDRPRDTALIGYAENNGGLTFQ